MGFSEGTLTFDSPNDKYIAGQIVHGKLEFQLSKKKSFRGIYIEMRGFCKVNWTTSHTRRVNDRRQTYYITHESHETYFDNKMYLVGSSNGDHELKPGSYVYPFTCQLPSNCPSSFEGSHGHVRYEFKAVVDRAFELDQELKSTIRVIAPYDLNADPYCREPMKFEFEESYCCWCISSGHCYVLAKVPASGFCPGQTVPIELSCDNTSNVEIKKIEFSIKKKITFQASQNPDTKHESDTIASLKKGPVPSKTKRNWTLEMEIPEIDAYNLNSCQYIDIDYEFKVKVVPSGCHKSSDGSERLVIGTIPLRITQELPPSEHQTSAYPASNSYAGNPNMLPFPDNQPPYPATPNMGHHNPNPASPYPNAPGLYPPGPNAPNPSPYPPAANASPYPTGPNASPYPLGPNAGLNPIGLNASPYAPGPNASPYPTGPNPSPYPPGPNASLYPPGANASPYPPGSNASLNPTGPNSSPYPTGPNASLNPTGPNASPYPTGPHASPCPTGPHASPYPTGPNAGLNPTGTSASPFPTGQNASPYPLGPNANPYPTGPNASPYPTGPNASLNPTGPNACPYPTGPNASPYPTGTNAGLNLTKPNASPYPTEPNASPYPPGPNSSPYPTEPKASPFPPAKNPSPYPSGANASPYPTGPNASPYPPGPNASPYPIGPNASLNPIGPNASPYPTGPNASLNPTGPNASPYPTGPNASPYPPGPNASPYPPGPNASPCPTGPKPSPYNPGSTGSGLKTGTLGFMGVKAPSLPPGAFVPMPMSDNPASPFVGASAPESATPDSEKKPPM